MGPFVLYSALLITPACAQTPQLRTPRRSLWDRGRTVKVDYATTARGRSTRAWCTETSLSSLSQKHGALTIITLVSDSVKGTARDTLLFFRFYAAENGFIWFFVISRAHKFMRSILFSFLFKRFVLKLFIIVLQLIHLFKINCIIQQPIKSQSM